MRSTQVAGALDPFRVLVRCNRDWSPILKVYPSLVVFPFLFLSRSVFFLAFCSLALLSRQASFLSGDLRDKSSRSDA